MAEDRYTFEQARARLEDIVKQVRDKDTSLEASLDLLEESVRLANQCTELIDHTQWRTALAEEAATAENGEADGAGDGSAEPAGVADGGTTGEVGTDAGEAPDSPAHASA